MPDRVLTYEQGLLKDSGSEYKQYNGAISGLFNFYEFSGFEFRIANSSSNTSGEIIISAFDVREQIDQTENWDRPPNSAFNKLTTFKTEGVDCPNPCPCVGFIYQNYNDIHYCQNDLH